MPALAAYLPLACSREFVFTPHVSAGISFMTGTQFDINYIAYHASTVRAKGKKAYKTTATPYRNDIQPSSLQPAPKPPLLDQRINRRNHRQR